MEAEKKERRKRMKKERKKKMDGNVSWRVEEIKRDGWTHMARSLKVVETTGGAG